MSCESHDGANVSTNYFRRFSQILYFYYGPVVWFASIYVLRYPKFNERFKHSRNHEKYDENAYIYLR